jgi:hypothetical protein
MTISSNAVIVKFDSPEDEKFYNDAWKRYEAKRKKLLKKKLAKKKLACLHRAVSNKKK